MLRTLPCMFLAAAGAVVLLYGVTAPHQQHMSGVGCAEPRPSQHAIKEGDFKLFFWQREENGWRLG